MTKKVYERLLDFRLAIGLLLIGWPEHACAEQGSVSDPNEIVVTARRLQPKRPTIDHYSTANINSLGAMTIGEVIARLERRNGGRPFSILVNGRRLADISDLSEVSPEALEHVDIIDGAHAGTYGFSPQNQILNLVLKPRFNSSSADMSLRQPTEGAATDGSASLRYTNIKDERRFNTAVTVQSTDALEVADRRNLIEPDQLDPLLFYRTLVPSSRAISVNSGLALPIGAVSLNLSANLNLARSRQISRFFKDKISQSNTNLTMPSSVHGIIDESLTRSYQISATASGNLGKTLWSAEVSGGHLESRTGSTISRRSVDVAGSAVLSALPGTFEPLKVRSDTDNLDMAFSGYAPILTLPAGDVTANARLSNSIQKIQSSTGTKSSSPKAFTQRRSQVHFGVDVPIIDSAKQVLGKASLTANGDYAQVSGIGGLPAYDFTFQWQPTDRLSVSIGRTVTKAQPTLGRNRDPVVYSPGSLVIDSATGQYGLVTRISGGVPDLQASAQTDDLVRLTFNSALRDTAISAILDYTATTITKPVILTAYPTPLFQRLFPSRFVRDPAGRLMTIDVRPFNGAAQYRRLVRLGAHISGHFAEEGEDEDEGGGGGGGVDWDLSLSHDWTLSDQLDPGQGNGSIDLLATPLDAVQGPRRRQASLDASASYKQMNIQLTAKWSPGETTRDISSDQHSTVHYAGLWILNAEISYTFATRDREGNLGGKPLRIWLSVENLFDRRLGVRTANGDTPTAFQPAFIDPIGRVVLLRLSKTL